jgi:plastocyanin
MTNLLARSSFLLAIVLISAAIGLAYTGVRMNTEAVAVNSLSMGDNFFAPATISVPVGSAVEWRNDGRLPHTTTSDAGAWDSDILRTGGTFSYVFDAPGAFTYICIIHPEMVGTIVAEAAAAPALPPAAAPNDAGQAPAAESAAPPAADTSAANSGIAAAPGNLPVGGGPPLPEPTFEGAIVLAALGGLFVLTGAAAVASARGKGVRARD